MSRNAYIRMALLATHPAFSWDHAALTCPLCFGSASTPFVTMRVAEYDHHFLAHNPSQEQCERFLSGKKYAKVCVQRGWDVDEAPKLSLCAVGLNGLSCSLPLHHSEPLHSWEERPDVDEFDLARAGDDVARYDR